MEIRRRPPNPTVRVENLEYAVPHREAQAKNILEEIVWHKDIEIKNFKKIVSLEDISLASASERPTELISG